MRISNERKDGLSGVDRMWDSQWVNVVNAPEVLEAVRNESAEAAVNIAVKLAEQEMGANTRSLLAYLFKDISKEVASWRKPSPYMHSCCAEAVHQMCDELDELIAVAIANATQQRNATGGEG